MAWTDPRTWVTNEVVTSTIMNTHVRDNLLGIQHPVHTESTTITINNSTTETSLFTTPPVIAGNAMGTSGWVRVNLWGSYVYNGAATETLTVRLKFGGVTHTAEVVGAAGASATTRGWRLEVDVVNLASASVQLIQPFSMSTGAQDSSDFAAPNVFGITAAPATGAVNTTSNQTLDITVQWSALSAGLTWTKRASRVMLMQA